MKLARVTHVRCNERQFDEPATYVWVDDDMTKEEFDGFVKAAQNAYDKAGEDFQKTEQPPYVRWGMPEYEKYPDKKVGEVLAEHEAAFERYKVWEARKREAQANFAHHLAAVSDGRIKEFFDVRPALDNVLNWGHRHGQKTAYGEFMSVDLGGTVPKGKWDD